MRTNSRRSVQRCLTAFVVAPALLLAACSDEPLGQELGPEDDPGQTGSCLLDLEFFSSTGVVRDGIPALTQPLFLQGTHPDVPSFLNPEDRVIGYLVGDEAYAVPHRILWYHEIANLSASGLSATVDLAVTYCPLTGSALVFDRAPINGAEFGVSGLLYKSNLMMYDRRNQVSLWPQMLGEARCGPGTGSKLTMYPSIEMTWAGWLSLHPNTQVLGEIAFERDFGRYPYGDYETRETFGFPMPPSDGRRHQKERVLGVRTPDGGAIALPFGSLAAKGNLAAIAMNLGRDRVPSVVLWDESRQAAMAYQTRVGEQDLTFQTTGSGFRDLETESHWTVDGRAVDGTLAGTLLEPSGEAFVAFWGAWQAFHQDTDLWGPGKPPPTLELRPGG
ncbi:MAG: DUF3179 domain-containing protein [Gemmatimonadetes bacterium]|nr:DUF3179 domain-containing protein [Gemmatimonadota bacterium]